MTKQDMPANPVDCRIGVGWELEEGNGETKYEKAFWQVYSAIMSDPSLSHAPIPEMADFAIKTVNAGFKALEERENNG